MKTIKLKNEEPVWMENEDGTGFIIMSIETKGSDQSPPGTRAVAAYSVIPTSNGEGSISGGPILIVYPDKKGEATHSIEHWQVNGVRIATEGICSSRDRESTDEPDFEMTDEGEPGA